MSYYPISCPYCGYEFEPQEWEIKRNLFGQMFFRCRYCNRKIKINSIEE